MNNKPRLLIVDDSLMIVKRIEKILESENIMIQAAYDGQHALLYMQEFQPDLILLDVELPDTNGFDLYEQLMRLDRNHVHIIFLTSRDDHVAVKKGITLGASDYIKKLVNKSQ